MPETHDQPGNRHNNQGNRVGWWCLRGSTENTEYEGFSAGQPGERFQGSKAVPVEEGESAGGCDWSELGGISLEDCEPCM